MEIRNDNVRMESHKFDRHTQTKRKLGALLRVSCSGSRVACDLVTSYFLVVTSLMRSCRTHIGVAYQSRHRADRQGGQRNLPEGLFVLLDQKKHRHNSRVCDFIPHHFCKASISYFLIFPFYFQMSAAGYFQSTIHSNDRG